MLELAWGSELEMEEGREEVQVEGEVLGQVQATEPAEL